MLVVSIVLLLSLPPSQCVDAALPYLRCQQPGKGEDSTEELQLDKEIINQPAMVEFRTGQRCEAAWFTVAEWDRSHSSGSQLLQMPLTGAVSVSGLSW